MALNGMRVEDAPVLDVERFLVESQRLIGHEVRERAAWNTIVTADSIRHFAYGIGDDNPRWLEWELARARGTGREAPPAYLISVLYPVVHGAPVSAPLSNLITRVEYSWFEPIREGDAISARALQSRVRDMNESPARRVISVDSEVHYWNQCSRLVATAKATLAKVETRAGELITNRGVYHYNDHELQAIEDAIEHEYSCRVSSPIDLNDFTPGQTVMRFVRGPLTVGDLVCWQAGVGPSYRAGPLGYRDLKDSPYLAVTNEATGWRVKYSQQHEDFLLAAGRGMPAPFDNGVMRFAQMSSAFTTMLSDRHELRTLKVDILAPCLYGDTTWYEGVLLEKSEKQTYCTAKIRLKGLNQLAEPTTGGVAVLHYPVRGSHVRSSYGWRQPRRSGGVHEVGGARSVVERFAQLAETYAAKTAVTDARGRLSYIELSEYSSKVSEWLLREGWAPGGGVVAVALQRGIDSIAVILGILKSGNAYLPLDPDLPPITLAGMVGDIKIAVVLTDELTAGLDLPPYIRKEPVDYEQIKAIRTFERTRHVRLTSDCPAYVMFSSGSVTAPKCVSISHGAVLSYVDSLESAMDWQAGNVYLHTAAAGFSASTRQTFFPLLKGNTLVVAGEAVRRDPRNLFRTIKEQGVTVWDTVPSVLGSFLAYLANLEEGARCRLVPDGLRYVFTTGEALPWALVERCCAIPGMNAQIWNLYSQTETGGTVCVFRVDRNLLRAEGIVPLGYELRDSPVELVDEHLEPVKEGEAGEIVVGGERISQGYLGHPSLTAGRYYCREEADGSIAPRYRTGDFARRHPEGWLEFVGRTDERVKVRGTGVDLGDLEKCVRETRGVQEAAVVAVERDNLDHVVVAYFVSGDGIDENALGKALQAVLPATMVPEKIVKMDALPRNPNGKIDRRGLTERAKQFVTKTIRGTGTEPDCVMMGIWADVLGTDEVQDNDDFFDLGGHSLMAVELVTEINRRFGAELSVTDLVTLPTPKQLLGLIRSGSRLPRRRNLVLLKKGGASPPLFCAPGIGGHLMRHQVLPRYIDDEQSLYGFQAVDIGLGDTESVTIESIASIYLAEMKEVQPAGPYYLFGTCFGGVLAYEIATQLLDAGDEVAMVVLVDTRAPDLIIPAYMKVLERLQKQYAGVRDLLGLNAGGRGTREVKAAIRQGRRRTGPPNEAKEASREARLKYRPRPLGCDAAIFKVEEPARRAVLDRRNPWRRVIKGEVTEKSIPGNRDTMLQEPLAQVLGRALNDYKNERRARAPAGLRRRP